MGYEVIFAECVVADYEVAEFFVFVIFDKVVPAETFVIKIRVDREQIGR